MLFQFEFDIHCLQLSVVLKSATGVKEISLNFERNVIIIFNIVYKKGSLLTNCIGQDALEATILICLIACRIISKLDHRLLQIFGIRFHGLGVRVHNDGVNSCLSKKMMV